MDCCNIRSPSDGIGGVAVASAICPLASVLCILGPVCLTGASADRTFGMSGAVAVRSLGAGGYDSISAVRTFGLIGLRGWPSGRTRGTDDLPGGAGACLGVELGATEDGNGSEDTALVSGVAGVCCSGIPGAEVSGSLG